MPNITGSIAGAELVGVAEARGAFSMFSSGYYIPSWQNSKNAKGFTFNANAVSKIYIDAFNDTRVKSISVSRYIKIF